MTKTLITLALVAACAAPSTFGAPPGDCQRYLLDPSRSRANAARVARDMAERREPLALYVVPAMSATKRLPDTHPTDGALFAPLSWIAARGEYEPASFVAYARETDWRGVEIQCDDLKTPTGDRIPAASIDFTIVKCWWQSGGAWHGYFADPTGRTLTPELLLHDEDLVRTDDANQDYYVRYENVTGDRRWAWLSARFDVTDYKHSAQAVQGLIRDAETLRPFVLNRGEYKQILATLHVPAGTPGGLYRGALRLVSGGKTLAALDLRCRVLPMDLPRPLTSYDSSKGYYLCLYGTDTRNPKVLKNLAAHNCLTPQHFPTIDPMNPAALDRDIALAKETGLLTKPCFFGVPSCSIINWNTKGASPEHLARIAALSNTFVKIRSLASEKLGHSEYYSYGVDEGGPAAIRGERDAWRTIHESGGRVGVSSYAWRELLFALDCLIQPGMPNDRRASEVRLFHASNPHALCGWYANPHTGPENPDYFRRIHGLMAWQAGYDVAINYCWWRNNWNDMATPYEPDLRGLVAVYGTADSVIDTLAWEGIREGLDDVRYATLCKQLATRAAESADGSLVLRGRRVLSWLAYWDAYREDPNAFRAEAINHILELNSLLNAKGTNE